MNLTLIWNNEGTAAAIKSPFSARDDIKDFYDREWDADLKAWITYSPEDFIDHMEARGWTVSVHNAPTPEVASWVQALYDSLPEHLRTPVYRALMQVLHPDVGGDHALAQQINTVFRAAS